MDYLYTVLIILTILILFFVILFGSKLLKKKNEFTYYSEDVEKWAANIDVQLEKQYDSINSIVSLIKNYDEKEYDFVKDVTALRQKNLSLFEKSHEMDIALQKVYSIIDRTPKITVTPMYSELLREIKKESNDTAAAKKRYNQIVSSYNKRISMSPYSYFAKIWGFEKKPLFQNSYGSVKKHKDKTTDETYSSKTLFK